MKRLRKNNGFTLVECVVAMAVLAVMTLGLMMILRASVAQRNNNMILEQNIDKQVGQVVQGDDVNSKEFGSEVGNVIEFNDGYKINGIKMVYVENDELGLQIGALDYTVAGVADPDEDSGNPGSPSPPASNIHSENWNVYGALEIDYINVQQDGNAVLNDDDTYTLTWKINFNYYGSASKIKSVKVVLPANSKIANDPKKTSASSDCNVHKIGNSIVRIQPKEWNTGYFEASVTFTVPASQYAAYVSNPGGFISDHFGKTQPDMFT